MTTQSEPLPVLCEDINFNVRGGVCTIGFVSRVRPAEPDKNEMKIVAARVSLTISGMRALRDELTNLLLVLDRNPDEAIN